MFGAVRIADAIALAQSIQRIWPHRVTAAGNGKRVNEIIIRHGHAVHPRQFGVEK
jgi:hypothetical protein